MKNQFSSRTLHNWLGVALVLPFFIVGMSTFFMSHEKSLGNMVIAYSQAPLELKDLLHTPDGRQLLASKNGLFQLNGDQFELITELQNNEIRTLELTRDGDVLAAGKYGLWLGKVNGAWTKLHDADIQGVQVQAQYWYLITKEKGVLVSQNHGGDWQPEKNISQSLSGMNYKNPVKLGKFMEDLHTGEALMGKHYEWIWADLLALALVILSLTGVYMWWKSQKRKLLI